MSKNSVYPKISTVTVHFDTFYSFLINWRLDSKTDSVTSNNTYLIDIRECTYKITENTKSAEKRCEKVFRPDFSCTSPESWSKYTTGACLFPTFYLNSLVPSLN